MEVQNIQVITNSKGEITCGDIGITATEWFELLRNPEARPYHKELIAIMRFPQHKASCTSLSKKYGDSTNHYNAKIIAFSKWVQKTLNRFKVIRPGGKECFWTIPMEKGADEQTGFVWYP